MKKILVTLALVVAATASAFAQIGIGAGYVNNAQKTGDNDPAASGGFYVEGFYSIPISGAFSIAPGLRYTYLDRKNGASATIFGVNVGASSNLTEHYMAIPVMAQYAVDLGGAQLIAFAGPSFSMGLSSKTVISGNAAGITGSSAPIDNYGDNSRYLRTNVFAGGGLGLQFGNIQIKAAYDFGLLNRYDSADVVVKDNQIRAGVAYVF